MCTALAAACGGTRAWALELLRAHPRTFDSFWLDAFGAPAPPAGDGGAMAPGDIDAILGLR